MWLDLMGVRMEASIKLYDDEIEQAIKEFLERKGYLVKALQYDDKKPAIILGHTEDDRAKGVFYYFANIGVEKI